MPCANALFRNRHAGDEALVVVVYLRHSPIVAVYIALYTGQNGRPSAAYA
jgi:hypothetical protein